MKKLALMKAASDFAFANYGETDKVKLAQASLSAFSAGGFDAQDLDVWNSAVNMSTRMWSQASMSYLPSEAKMQLAMPKIRQPDPIMPGAPEAAIIPTLQ